MKISTSGPWRLVHSEGVIRRLSAANGTAFLPDTHEVFTGTEEECRAEATRLGLITYAAWRAANPPTPPEPVGE